MQRLDVVAAVDELLASAFSSFALEGCSVQGAGGGLFGIEPQRIELIGRIDNAHAEEFRPHVVHRGAGELEVAGDELRERGRGNPGRWPASVRRKGKPA